MKIYYLNILYPLISSVIVIVIFGAPKGSDWAAYQNYAPKNFGFYREFFSWSIINLFLKDLNISSTFWFLSYYFAILLATIKAFRSLGGQNYYLLYPLMFSNFYLQFACNGLRQGLAFLFILIGIASKRFVLNAFFAVFSHNSAITVFGWFSYRGGIVQILYLLPGLLFFLAYSMGFFSDKYSVTPGNNKYIFATVLLILASYFLYKQRLTYFLLCSLVFVTFDNSNVFVRLTYYLIPLGYIHAAALVRTSPALKYLAVLSVVCLSPVFYLHPSIGEIWGY